MKYTVVLLFALVVASTSGRASTCDQCVIYPTALSSLRIGDIIRDFVYQVVRTIVKVSEAIFESYIPANTVVPVQEIFTEYAAQSCQTLRVWTEVSFRLLNLPQLCPLLNAIPLQIQNIRLDAAAISQYIASHLQGYHTGAPVYFPEWSKWSSEFQTQLVTSDIVYLFNNIRAL